MERIKIPERFREDLLARFDPENATKDSDDIGWWVQYQINISCPLCREFLYGCKKKDGTFCPFKLLDLKGQSSPCVNFVESLVDDWPIDWSNKSIVWFHDNNSEARAWLAELREKALEQIEWVKEDNDDSV